MKSYDTVTEAIIDLCRRGFTHDLNISFDKNVCGENNTCLSPLDFEITETYRFDGNTNPSDEDIIYAISSKDGKIKGIFTEAFGTYADEDINHLILGIKTRSNLAHG